MLLLTKLALVAGGGKLIQFISKGLNTKDTGEKLVIDPISVAWKGLHGTFLKFSLKLKVFNPTKNDITINYFYSDIFIKSYKFATAKKVNYNKVVKAEKETFINVDVIVTGLNLAVFLVTSLGKLIKEGKYPKSIIMEGNIKANGFTVPFNEEVNVIA